MPPKRRARSAASCSGAGWELKSKLDAVVDMVERVIDQCRESIDQARRQTALSCKISLKSVFCLNAWISIAAAITVRKSPFENPRKRGTGASRLYLAAGTKFGALAILALTVAFA